ncbi:MAG TPA: hypothetical protein PLY87_09795 [Planctomycetaceae bacterium]|nr:hypothetical protein [Planctomycetaceae bacterium]HQZ65358.1 hypothetical protein [Planctomycetaceae bacterium]
MAIDTDTRNFIFETDAIQIEDVRIGISEVLQILHRRGHLKPAFQKAAEDTIVATHSRLLGFAPTDAQLQQATDQFRRRSGLLSVKQTQNWLAARHLSEVDFEEIVLQRMRYAFVFTSITEPAALSFQSASWLWDRWTYRELFVPSESLVEELKCQHLEEGVLFADLADRNKASHPARRESLARSSFRAMLPQWISEASDGAISGSLIGPLACRSGWALIFVETVTPAVFDQETESAIRHDLFQQWLSARIRESKISYPLLDLHSCQNDC